MNMYCHCRFTILITITNIVVVLIFWYVICWSTVIWIWFENCLRWWALSSRILLIIITTKQSGSGAILVVKKLVNVSVIDWYYNESYMNFVFLMYVCIRCWMIGGNDPILFGKFVSYCDCICKSPSDNGPDNTNDCSLTLCLIFWPAFHTKYCANIVPQLQYLQLLYMIFIKT